MKTHGTRGLVRGTGSSFQRHAKDALVSTLLGELVRGDLHLPEETPRPDSRLKDASAAWRARQRRLETLHNLITIGHARLDIRGDEAWATITRWGRAALGEEKKPC